MEIKKFTRNALLRWTPTLARLCTTVFREWPHLYDGDGAYDGDHLRALVESPRSALFIAFDGVEPVGASTCLPLAEATAEVQAPFHARGWPLERYFYFPESVLLPPYRGRGVGRAFFSTREAHARAVSDCEFACFCAGQRSNKHPAFPVDGASLENFWLHRGYLPSSLKCRMRWKEIGSATERMHRLQFWIKPLRVASRGGQQTADL